MPMGMRFDVLADGRVFSTNDLISATSLSKCATALGRFSKEISFLLSSISFYIKSLVHYTFFSFLHMSFDNLKT